MITRRIKHIKLDSEEMKNFFNVASFYDDELIPWITTEQETKNLEDYDILPLDEKVAGTKLSIMNYGEGYIVYEGADAYYHVFIC